MKFEIQHKTDNEREYQTIVDIIRHYEILEIEKKREFKEQGISVLEDGQILVKNSEENKDVIRMLGELTE